MTPPVALAPPASSRRFGGMQAELVDRLGPYVMARPTTEAVNARKRELNDKQLSYVIWAATPEGLREPRTQDEFALAVGVVSRTVRHWAKDPRIAEAIRFVVVQNAGNPEMVGKILDMVAQKAIDGATKTGDALKAAEVWLKATGVMTSATTRSTVLDALDDADGFSEFSDEMLEQMKAAAKAMEDEREAMRRAAAALSSAAVVGD